MTNSEGVGRALALSAGAKVAELRKAMGWSQEELAARMGRAGYPMHQTTVAKLESVTRPTSVEELGALAEIFGVSVKSLLDETKRDDFPDVIAHRIISRHREMEDYERRHASALKELLKDGKRLQGMVAGLGDDAISERVKYALEVVESRGQR